MNGRRRVVMVVGEGECLVQEAFAGRGVETERVASLAEAARRLQEADYLGLFVSGSLPVNALPVSGPVDLVEVLENFPDGVVLLDKDHVILWANRQFRQWVTATGGNADVVGCGFYAALGNPEILGPDFCPFHTTRAAGTVSTSTLRVADNRYFQLHVAPVLGQQGPPQYLIVAVRDVTAEMLQQQKINAIHKAGIELADIKPEEIFHLSVEERVEILKANILRYTQDLLHYNVVEIRLLDLQTGELMPLLAVGLTEESARRRLFARTKDNGVTGFVAATGKSYLCEDTREDPLYLEGLRGGRSSLTVPLMLHDQVIGTFNVESPEPRAFNESDLQFLEMFSRDVALALNTLELLKTQQFDAAQRSVEAIHSAIARPMDEILNDVVNTLNVMERYIGNEPEVLQRLQRILRNARDIKQVIHKIGQRMAPVTAIPAVAAATRPPRLQGRRVLVVDADESVRNDAHHLLEKHGCIVETSHTGNEALFMVRSCSPGDMYDAIISDIRLPDMNGYEFFMKLKSEIDPVPMILMTGFGWDPGHSIVKARQAGLLPKAVLYKPFRLDQLLDTLEMVIENTRRPEPASQC